MSDSPADDTLPGYFIAPDANGDLAVWREQTEHNVDDFSNDYPVLYQNDLRHEPALWNVLAAAIRTVEE